MAQLSTRLLRSAHPRLRGRADRRAVILTTAMLFLLPLLVLIGLSMTQIILIRTASRRVEAATEAAVLVASKDPDESMSEVHYAAGLVLTFLGGDYRTERQFFDVWDADNNMPGSDGEITSGDQVAVGVTIPMGLVSTNYLHALGVNVGDLRMRWVLTREID